MNTLTNETQAATDQAVICEKLLAGHFIKDEEGKLVHFEDVVGDLDMEYVRYAANGSAESLTEYLYEKINAYAEKLAGELNK